MYEAYSINSDNEFISQELKLESELSQNVFMVAAYQKYVVLITNLADAMIFFLQHSEGHGCEHLF